MFRISHYHLLLLAAIIGAGLIYSPALNYPFVWDDMEVVRDNIYLRQPLSPGLFFQSHFWRDMLPISKIDYRPFQMIALRLIGQFGGPDPIYFRSINLLLHLLVSFIVWKLALYFKTGRTAALLAAILFAYHPVHVETIVNARNISELLMTILILLSWFIFFRGGGIISLLLSLLIFITALLCKESALIFPVLLTASVLIGVRGKRRTNRIIVGTVLFWLVAIIGATVKILISSGGGGFRPPPLPVYIVSSAKLVLSYVRLLILPVRLKVLYPFGSPSIWYNSEFFLYLLAAIFILIIVICINIHKHSHILRWALICLALSLLPSLIKIGQEGRTLAEQRLYFPSVFYCILGGVLIDRVVQWYRRRSPYFSFLPFILICLFFAGLTVEYLSCWKSNFDLWSRVTVLSPNSALAHNNLGIAFHRKGDDQRAITELQEALRLEPSHKEAHNNLGILYMKSGRRQEAADEFKASIRTDPDYYPAALNLGKMYLRFKLLEQAEDIVENVVEKHPYLPRAYNCLGIILEESGKYDRAEAAYYKAAELDSEYVIPLRNLSKYFQSRGKLLKALEVGREALYKDPDSAEGYSILSRIYIAKGNFIQAHDLLKKGLDRNPTNLILKSQLMALRSSGVIK
jgi:protein O-mannosyl-transferase